MDQERDAFGHPAPTPLAEPATEPRFLPPQAPQHQPQQHHEGRRWGGGILAGLIALVAKGKAILLFLPKLKLLTTSGSMLVSIAAYSFIFGWRFAVGFVLLLFVHEMGHVIQLRREGIQASAPVFIPFLGAAVWAKSLGGNALAEARVGLAGPVLGTVGSAVCYLIYGQTDDEFWRALAFSGFFLNLFNLLPVVPLDGGRAMAAMSPRVWFLGFFAMVLLAFLYPNPIIIIIALFAGMELYRRWKQRREGGEEVLAYYRVKPIHRAMVAAVYLGLIAILVLGMDVSHLARDFNDV